MIMRRLRRRRSRRNKKEEVEELRGRNEIERKIFIHFLTLSVNVADFYH